VAADGPDRRALAAARQAPTPPCEQRGGGNGVLRRVRADARPLAGTRLLREWRGVEHAVSVLAEGFE
jgi:hypothetical protein